MLTRVCTCLDAHRHKNDEEEITSDGHNQNEYDVIKAGCCRYQIRNPTLEAPRPEPQMSENRRSTGSPVWACKQLQTQHAYLPPLLVSVSPHKLERAWQSHHGSSHLGCHAIDLLCVLVVQLHAWPHDSDLVCCLLQHQLGPHAGSQLLGEHGPVAKEKGETGFAFSQAFS